VLKSSFVSPSIRMCRPNLKRPEALQTMQKPNP
jgi:hypothetical protein